MKPSSVHYFADAKDLARSLARELGAVARPITVHAFPDRESRVRVVPDSGRSAVLIRRLDDPNPKLFELLLAIDALRRNRVRRIALVAPYLPYMRQDRSFEAGESVSQRVIAELLGGRVDRLVTLEPHLHRIHDLAEVFACPSIAVPAAPLLADWCRRGGARTLIVGPDEESAPWTRAIADRAGLPFVVGRKRRAGDRRVRVSLPELPAVDRAVLIDDIASTGETLAAAARELARAGIRRIDAAVVHAIFAKGAASTLRRAGVLRIVSCDTVVHPSNGIATAKALAAAIRAPASRGRLRTGR